MKKILFASLLTLTSLFSTETTNNSISLDLYTASHHLNKDFDYNKQHKYIGVNYQFENNILNKDFFTELGVATFKNSYYDKTYFVGTTIGHNTIQFDVFDDFNITLGAQLSFGIQKGYCDYGKYDCNENNKNNDVSPFIVPSLFTKFEDLKITYFYMPNVVGIKFGIDVLKW